MYVHTYIHCQDLNGVWRFNSAPPFYPVCFVLCLGIMKNNSGGKWTAEGISIDLSCFKTHVWNSFRLSS